MRARRVQMPEDYGPELRLEKLEDLGLLHTKLVLGLSVGRDPAARLYGMGGDVEHQADDRRPIHHLHEGTEGGRSVQLPALGKEIPGAALDYLSRVLQVHGLSHLVFTARNTQRAKWRAQLKR